MARNNEYRNVARVAAKVGKQGEVKVEPIDDLPFLLSEGMEVFLTPPPLQGVRSSVIERIREQGDGWAVKFADSNSPADAFELVGRLCLVAEADLPEFEEPFDPRELVGLAVHDLEFGDLGSVSDVLVSSEQITLVVADDSGHETLIPFVAEFLMEYDEDLIVTRVPEGILKLN
ncbi:MAG: ribosome maturation factor RimM [Coriobacteriales bacterium]|jgi:ribosomal 30S subunit maturation factor RimM